MMSQYPEQKHDHSSVLFETRRIVNLFADRYVSFHLIVLLTEGCPVFRFCSNRHPSGLKGTFCWKSSSVK